MNMTMREFLQLELRKKYGASGVGPNASPQDVHNAFVHAENAKRQSPQQLQSDPQQMHTYGQVMAAEHAKEKNSSSQRSKSMPISVNLNVGQQGMKMMQPGPEVWISGATLVQSDGPFDIAVAHGNAVIAKITSEEWKQNRNWGFDTVHLPKNAALALILRNRHNGPNQVQMIFEGVSQWR